MGSDRNPKSGLAVKNPVNIKNEADELKENIEEVENKQPYIDKTIKKNRKISINDN
jgi:hypothetical protein